MLVLQGPAAAASKEAMLLALCSKTYASGRTIVFFRTKACSTQFPPMRLG